MSQSVNNSASTKIGVAELVLTVSRQARDFERREHPTLAVSAPVGRPALFASGAEAASAVKAWPERCKALGLLSSDLGGLRRIGDLRAQLLANPSEPSLRDQAVEAFIALTDLDVAKAAFDRALGLMVEGDRVAATGSDHQVVADPTQALAKDEGRAAGQSGAELVAGDIRHGEVDRDLTEDVVAEDGAEADAVTIFEPVAGIAVDQAEAKVGDHRNLSCVLQPGDDAESPGRETASAMTRGPVQ